MTKAVFRVSAPSRSCSVCGADFAPRGPNQRICRQKDANGKLTECGRAAQKIRWYRAALRPSIAEKYGMSAATVESRLKSLLAGVRDADAFAVPRGAGGGSRRKSLAGQPVIGVTEKREPIIAVDEGEVIGQQCSICGEIFDGPPGACGESACRLARRKAKNRAYHQAHKVRRIANITEARRRRVAARQDPWATPAPPWDGHLPGAVLPIDIFPGAPVPGSLGPALHGVLTGILRGDRGHDSTRPEWSLLLVGEATTSGWAVWLPIEDDVARVRGKMFDVTLRGVSCRLAVGRGVALRLKPPHIDATGRHRVRLTTITPVCMRSLGSHGRSYRSYPQTPTIWSALASVADRIGLVLPDPTTIGVVRVSHATAPVSASLNRARGIRAVGWEGDVVLDVNPLGRWLVEVAARIGLGGRTAYGFGRVVVRDEPAQKDTPVPSLAPWEVVVEQAAEKFGRRMGIGIDEARAGVAALVEQATFERFGSNGYEVWRAGDVLLVAQPTTMRLLRVVDVVDDTPAADEHPIADLWREHAA